MHCPEKSTHVSLCLVAECISKEFSTCEICMYMSQCPLLYIQCYNPSPCSSNVIAASQYDQIERAATEQLKTSSAAAQVSLLELITNLGLRSQRLLQAVLPLLVSKDTSVRRSSFAAIHQLAGVSNKAGLERLMADMGLIQESAVHDEVQSHIQSNSCTSFVFATASCLQFGQ